MRYSVHFPTTNIQKKFRKTLQSISPPTLQEDIIQAIETLADHPRPAGEPKIKPPLVVYQFTAQYRLRVKNYRILYDVDDTRKIVWLLDVRKRTERTYR